MSDEATSDKAHASTAAGSSHETTRMAETPPTISGRIGQPLDYAALRRAYAEEPENARARYRVGGAFVSARIDRANPLDRVLVNNRWFQSGNVVSRLSACGRRVYAQIIYLFRALETGDLYYASLLELRPRDGVDEPSLAGRFDAALYEVDEPSERLVPLSALRFVAYAPSRDGYLQPHAHISDVIERAHLRDIQAAIDDERREARALERHLVPANVRARFGQR